MLPHLSSSTQSHLFPEALYDFFIEQSHPVYTPKHIAHAFITEVILTCHVITGSEDPADGLCLISCCILCVLQS